MDLEIRHLRYFVAVAEELSFSTAAQRLHMAQPPLSRAVKALENQLGVVLLERTTRRVELTEAGRLLLEESRSAIDRFDSALARAAQAGRIEGRSLRIGFRPAASLPLLEPIVREFRLRNPHMSVETSRIEWSDQISCLLTGRVDVAFVLHPVAHHQVTVADLLAARRAVAMPSDHPLGTKSSIQLAELSGHALAIPKGATAEWQGFWTATPRPIDVDTPNPPIVGNADESFAAVLSGQAFVIAISTVMTYYRDGSLSLVPIDDIAPAVIGLASREESEHPGIPAFAEVATEMAESLASDLTLELGTTVVAPSRMTELDLSRPLDPVPAS